MSSPELEKELSELKSDIINSQVWGCILSPVEVTKRKMRPLTYIRKENFHGRKKSS